MASAGSNEGSAGAIQRISSPIQRGGKYLVSHVDPFTPKLGSYVKDRLKDVRSFGSAHRHIRLLQQELDNNVCDFVVYWRDQNIGINTLLARYERTKKLCYLIMFIISGLLGIFFVFGFKVVIGDGGLMGATMVALQIGMFLMVYASLSMHLWRIRTYSIYAVHWWPAVKADLKELLPLGLPKTYGSDLKEMYLKEGAARASRV